MLLSFVLKPLFKGLPSFFRSFLGGFYPFLLGFPSFLFFGGSYPCLKVFFPKNSSGVGFSFSFLEKGAWSESGRTVPIPCPSRAHPVPVPRGSSLSSTRNAHFKKMTLSSTRNGPLAVPWPSGALSSTRNGHFKIESRFRLRETVRWPFVGSSVALSPTRNVRFNIKHRSRLRETVLWLLPGSSTTLSSTRNALSNIKCRSRLCETGLWPSRGRPVAVRRALAYAKRLC